MNIRPANSADVPAIIALMRGFAEYEKLLEYFEVTERKLSEVLFDHDSFVDCLIAEDTGETVAYAIFYPNFATFRGQLGMYLEDLYISPEFRGNGIGEAMLREIAKIAAGRGYERIDFQVLDWNETAIGFYHKLGAAADDAERHFKFTDQAFYDLAK
jgi:ribosomal protein S18 acetylase RimI-like enzyme